MLRGRKKTDGGRFRRDEPKRLFLLLHSHLGCVSPIPVANRHPNIGYFWTLHHPLRERKEKVTQNLSDVRVVACFVEGTVARQSWELVTGLGEKQLHRGLHGYLAQLHHPDLACQ